MMRQGSRGCSSYSCRIWGAGSISSCCTAGETKHMLSAWRGLGIVQLPHLRCWQQVWHTTNRQQT